MVVKLSAPAGRWFALVDVQHRQAEQLRQAAPGAGVQGIERDVGAQVHGRHSGL